MTDFDIAKTIHYPDCWDTMAYPTLATALWEMLNIDWKNSDCPTCHGKQGYIESSEVRQ